MTCFLECDDLTFGFGKTLLFESCSIRFLPNQMYTVLGLAQSGKSTLMKIMVGLIPNVDGNILLFGENLYSVSTRMYSSLMKKIGVAFQQGALFDYMTVLDNLKFILKNQRPDWSLSEQEERIRWYLSYMKLEQALHKLPSQLSGGMKRRVGVIRSLIAEPQLVFLDEPTAGLDPVNSALTIDLIKQLQKERACTMVCFTSIPEIAKQVQGTIYLLYQKRMLEGRTWSECVEHEHPDIRKWISSRLIG